MLARLWSWLKDEEGQGLAEYGLIVILIAVLVVAAMAIFSPAITGLFGRVASQLSNP
ncbi:MAG: Flp family type IVb pilin [Bacillota bacterium]|nr:Flp family type IVb pilin [Bacillota bacterium]